MAEFPQPHPEVQAALKSGLAIPAHPLALTGDRKLDERRQRALARYYHAAGAGGLAVGVHTTQFAIRAPEHGLFRPVLELAAETLAVCDRATGRRTVRIAGVCGPTPQALEEAAVARDYGYDLGLLSLGALSGEPENALLDHCRGVAQIIPLVGFYLQPAAGGRELSFDFWVRFAQIPNVAAIKVAPFNRYATLDVVRAVAAAGRWGEIALYTGNDDHIVLDLLAEFEFPGGDGKPIHLRFAGGLLGHWACWTRSAVDLLGRCQEARREAQIAPEMLVLAHQVTDCNAAFFDAANRYAGVIAGIHEVLRRQGLLANRLCLDPEEDLSPGQAEEIDRVVAAYPHLNDDAFVREHLDEWLS